MAATKAVAAIGQLTATGTSTTLAFATSSAQSLYLSHSNGTGTVTTQGTATVEVRPSGSSRWYALPAIGFGTATGGVQTNIVPLPEDAAAVRVLYTAPAGATGPTLDAELGTATY